MTLDEINTLNPSEFVGLFGEVFEQAPWVAQQAWEQRPFTSLDDLHAKMIRILRNAPHERQIELMRAHPQLTGRIADRQDISEASSLEQAAAGLDACTPEQMAELSELNCKYFTRHGFPFIIAVRGLTVCEILEQMRQRTGRSTREEFEENLRQIERIARLRLEALIDAP